MAIAARASKLPNFILYPFFILSILKRFISLFLSTLGLSVSMESAHDATQQLDLAKQIESANLIRKILPIMKYNVYISTNNINDECTTAEDGCAVCLCEFESQDEIRLLMGCRHIFHRSCLDGWIDHDRGTCPLCRTPFIPAH